MRGRMIIFFNTVNRSFIYRSTTEKAPKMELFKTATQSSIFENEEFSLLLEQQI